MKPKQKSVFPSRAKPVYQGKIFEIWQWKQKMFDGSIEVFEGLKRCNSVEIFAAVGNKVILQQQWQPHLKNYFFSLPGGRMDYGDNALIEAKRELLEETGYTSDDWILWKKIQPHMTAQYTVSYFIARNCYLKQKPDLDGGEKIVNKFITFNELLKITDNPKFRGSETITMLLRLRLDSKTRMAFKHLLFRRRS